jgi:molybdopterin-guanine dinucleotide biosynthesis adapter protein
MPPVVSIVGYSGSGKTTLLEKLVLELGARGYRVATAKHAPDETLASEIKKDTGRHLAAGSRCTALCARDGLIIALPMEAEMNAAALSRVFGEDYDIILTEGFKSSDTPKIEVHRRDGGPTLEGLSKLVVIATDEALPIEARQIPLDDVKGLADLLEKGFLKPNRERLSLYVNGEMVKLSAFPRDIVRQLVLAIVKALKGVGNIRRVEIDLACPDEADAESK